MSRWQPLVDEARAIPKGTPPSSVPHWREEVDWDWRRRPKAPVLWHGNPAPDLQGQTIRFPGEQQTNRPGEM